MGDLSSLMREIWGFTRKPSKRALFNLGNEWMGGWIGGWDGCALEVSERSTDLGLAS